MAKLCSKVQPGYSKSVDKVRQALLDSTKANPQSFDLLQFLEPTVMQNTRYLTENLPEEEDKKETKDAEKEKDSLEKTVNIRFANYSAMVRA
jgi:hypothetical protein